MEKMLISLFSLVESEKVEKWKKWIFINLLIYSPIKTKKWQTKKNNHPNLLENKNHVQKKIMSKKDNNKKK